MKERFLLFHSLITIIQKVTNKKRALLKNLVKIPVNMEVDTIYNRLKVKLFAYTTPRY
jgi:hypothetical protein